MSISENGEGRLRPGELLEALREPGSALCREASGKGWLLFRSPAKTLSARSIPEVQGVLDEAGAETAKGNWAAGFVAYEASPAFDPAMEVKTPEGPAPLAYFAVYEKPSAKVESFEDVWEGAKVELRPEISKELHCARIEEAKGCIDRGETYQVNLTFRLRGQQGSVSPGELFLRLASSHPVPFMAYVNTGELQICSLSPESFLERSGRAIATEPMKGTARRLAGSEEDRQAALWLGADEKNRAENLMIVDMCRNDLGRICEPGSVKAPELFKVLSYPTVHQMVSRVEGLLPGKCGLFEIFKATFPPASITGAPKIMAMEKIASFEPSPRGVYTGCVGCARPDGGFLFNVAIRTALFSGGAVELGVGGGIVADSAPELEWDECLAKASFLNHKPEDFKLLETILWSRKEGFAFLKEHVARAKASQAYFGRKWIEGAFEESLKALRLESSGAGQARIRTLVDKDGGAVSEWSELKEKGWGKEFLKALIPSARTESSRALLRHKTTARKLYDEAFKAARAAGFDEALFLNEKGELAEGAITNVILKAGSVWLTPAPACGLLEGVWRASMAKTLNFKEARLGSKELLQAEEILLGNSVRGGARVGELWMEPGEPGAKPKLVWSAGSASMSPKL